MAPRKLAAALALGGLALPAAAAGADARLAPPGCITVEVQPGDNAWTIGQRAGVTLDVISTLNPHIANLALIHPGDTIAVACPGLANITANPALPAPIIVANEMTRAAVDVSKWAGETERCWRNNDPNQWFPCMTWRAVVANLYLAGFRGDDLLTMAAIIPGESARDPQAVGDTAPKYLVDGWIGSYGFTQIRAHQRYTDTGYLRDVNRLKTGPLEQAKAAFELYVENRRQFTPWSAYLNGSWQKSDNGVTRLDQARRAASEIGVIA